MNKNIIDISIGYFTFIWVYLMWSFAMWDTNPGNWNETSRIFFAFFASVASIGAVAMKKTFDSDDSEE